MQRKLKPKKCRWCSSEFVPWNSTQINCSPSCAIDYVRDKEENKLRRDVRRAESIKRKEVREAKERLKSRSDHLRDAQKACNAYIRERDKDEACISCGRFDGEINGYLTGGKWDAGHFKTRGGFPELRFNPLNVHKQCKSCNGGSGKFSKKEIVVSVEYRERLIKKIGLSSVEWLEGPHQAQNLTIDDIVEIKKYYQEQLKILKG